MLSTYHPLALYTLLPSLVLSLALNSPPPANSILQPTGPQNETITPYVLGLDSTSRLAGGYVNCNERLYGNPSIDSCKDAVRQIPQDVRTLLVNEKRIYGPRDQDTTASFDVGLPKRWISGDGGCIVDITQTGFPSHCTDGDIFVAGTMILQHCVEEEPPITTPWGGEAIDMGDEKTLKLTVQAYKPPFLRCANAPAATRPKSSACKSILDTMKASTEQTRFGAVGVPDVQTELPQSFTDSTNACTISIDIIAPDDTASWYDLWAAAVALDGMCARGGRTGKSRFLGANRKIVVEIKK